MIVLGKRNIITSALGLKLVKVCGRGHNYGCGPVGWLLKEIHKDWGGPMRRNSVFCLSSVLSLQLFPHGKHSFAFSFNANISTVFCFGLCNFSESTNLHIRGYFLITFSKTSVAVGVQIFFYQAQTFMSLALSSAVSEELSLWAKADPPLSSRSKDSLKLLSAKACIH